ncbi:MAG TPA: EVE domain-containing protein [Polyangiaceae bacterium]|jgi:predicted RNA-binding protein with PUA-like domain|nr:EVE domain-containing protein [Polyangiaceae bacterium]
MATSHWLVKSEPFKYSWQKFVADKKAVWDGVRNFEARNNLRAMKKGDLVLFYHSNEGKEVVGIAAVAKEAYPDPTATEGDWSVVELTPKKALSEPVSLSRVKADKQLSEFALVRKARISVIPATPAEFARVLELGKTKL